MGWNDHIDDQDDCQAIAIEAGAIKVCPAHSDVTVNQGDSAANSRAYAIATNRLKDGDLVGDRQEVMDGIKDAIEQSADECPYCAELRNA